MSSDDIAISVQNLSKRYEIYATPRDRLKQFMLPKLRRIIRVTAAQANSTPEVNRYFKEFWALREITFKVRKGETLGVIGRNGSGKSTLLQIIAGTLSPTGGVARVNGRVAALLELGSGFNPDFTGRENVYLNGQILGLSQREIEARYPEIAAFADIGDFIDQPVKVYSSGMFLRLAFAVQAHIDASVVIIDEALTVGDVFFRQKCYARLEQLRRGGAAILLVSHSMPDIEQYCERALVLDRGRMRFMGSSSEAAKHYYLLDQATRSNVNPMRPEKAARATLEESYSPSIVRSLPQACIDISGKTQIGNGLARCIRAALCDAQGYARNNFRQGERAVFYYEFRLEGVIGVPIGGIVISNDRGTIVFGRHNWQYDVAPIGSVTSNCIVACRQEVVLDLGVGEYTFEIGLALVSPDDWERRKAISHEESEGLFQRLCHISAVSSFSVGYADRDGVAVLTHHGVANLPGSMEVVVQSGIA